jgi:predicted HD superfamily hydrolase involved in NAD metabolism
MDNHDSIIEELGKRINERRLKHSIGVSRCAKRLALHYNQNAEKAELAGLVHDCAKGLSYEDSIYLAKKFGYEPDEIERINYGLLHAPVGAILAQEMFGIRDKEILDAIACHTTGKKGMSIFEKIIFLADYIEEGRSFQGVEEIRSLAFTDLNQALLRALEQSIRRILDRNKLLHPMTVDARNALLLEIRDVAPYGKTGGDIPEHIKI